jgi:hypothetical protein
MYGYLRITEGELDRRKCELEEMSHSVTRVQVPVVIDGVFTS